jgi:metabolite-proton symporter
MSSTSSSTGRIVLASLVGTAIEYYDFYIYGTAAALVFGPLFFPGQSAAAQVLSAFATFAIAFVARPLGAALFGHFGDRIGRKSTLVASLLIVGSATTLIGLLPGYASLGTLAPLLLCLLRFLQGLGLGGEWGGAALLATENAPPGKRAWWGQFPQQGAPLGFIMSNGLFLLLAVTLSDAQFRAWGWRLPFLLSGVLLGIGLYLRLRLTETPVFRDAVAREERVRVPMLALLRGHFRAVALGTLSMVVVFAVFYLTTVFTLSYGIKTLHFPRQQFLALECFAILFLALGIVLAVWLADRLGRRPVLLAGCVLIGTAGFLLAPLFAVATAAAVVAWLSLALFAMGLVLGPVGAFLPELFPTPVRYTGATLAYNFAGILGASYVPYIAQLLVDHGGLAWVGLYLAAMAAVSFTAVWLAAETRDVDWTVAGGA